MENLREGIDKLKGCLKEKEKLKLQKDNSTPARCPDCGCEESTEIALIK